MLSALLENDNPEAMFVQGRGRFFKNIGKLGVNPGSRAADETQMKHRRKKSIRI
jgi:hypothetical protein